MGRKYILFGFWMLGFTLGFTGYLASPWVGKWLTELLLQIFANETLVGAFLSGIAGSLITTASVALLAKLPR